jgi:hypothetical protein
MVRIYGIDAQYGYVKEMNKSHETHATSQMVMLYVISRIGSSAIVNKAASDLRFLFHRASHIYCSFRKAQQHE